MALSGAVLTIVSLVGKMLLKDTYDRVSKMPRSKAIKITTIICCMVLAGYLVLESLGSIFSKEEEITIPKTSGTPPAELIPPDVECNDLIELIKLYGDVYGYL